MQKEERKTELLLNEEKCSDELKSVFQLFLFSTK